MISENHKQPSRAKVPSLLIMIVILTSAVNVSYWIENRIFLGGFPISIPDLVISVYGIYGSIIWLRSPYNFLNRNGIGVLLILWFAYNSYVGLILGISAGNPEYAILQEYRVVLYTFIGYFSTMAIFKPEKHLNVIIHGFIWAGVIVCLWQISIVIFVGRLGEVGDVSILENTVSRPMRDVNLPLYFASSAFVFLTVVRIEAPNHLGIMRYLYWILMLIFLSVPVLSMTRTIWFAEALSVVLLILYYLIYFIRKRQFHRFSFFVFGIIFSFVFLITILKELSPQIYSALGIVLDFTFSPTGSDSTSYERLNVPQVLINYFLTEGSFFWIGLGFGNIGGAATTLGPYIGYAGLHNVYLSYLVFSGLFGLLLFLAVWFSPFIPYFHLLSQQTTPLIRAYIIASIINLIVLSLLIYTMPPHWAESALLGMMLAVVSILSRRKKFIQQVINCQIN